MDPFAPANYSFSDFANGLQGAMGQMQQMNLANQGASLTKDAMSNQYQIEALKNQRYNSLLQALSGGLGGLGGGGTKLGGFQATGPGGKVISSGTLGTGILGGGLGGNLPQATAAYDNMLAERYRQDALRNFQVQPALGSQQNMKPWAP